MSIRSTFTTLAAVALTAALAPMTVAAPAGASVAPAGAAAPRAVTATVVTTQFGSGTYGVFAESMARLGRGLLVSITTGHQHGRRQRHGQPGTARRRRP